MFAGPRNSETGAHLWADRFDGSLDEVFELQDRVTASVVGAITPRLDQAEMARAQRKPIENLDAYDCLLRGLDQFYRSTEESEERARDLFYRAIDIDPHFATPYGMATRCYTARKIEGRVIDREWEEAETRRLALQVQVLGSDDAVALCWAGFALAYVCREYGIGSAMVDEALSINPNLAGGWRCRGMISIHVGQHALAVEQLTRALRLSPVGPDGFGTEASLSSAYFYQDRPEEALKWAGRALAHRSDSRLARRALVLANVLAGNLGEAKKLVAELRELDPLLSITNIRNSIAGVQRPQDIDKYIAGMRLAGLPE